jgi:hypothetical protein
MYRPIIEIDDDDDRRRVLKHGETLRVPVMMMDGLDPVEKALAAAYGGKSIIDQLAREIFADDKMTDAQRMADAARTARIREIENAWRNPSNYPWKDNKPASTTFELTTPVTDARGRAEEAREKRLELIRNAWRFAR